MSSKNRRRNRELQSLQPHELSRSYLQSVNRNPQLHHPGISQQTASPDHIRRDFLTWASGYQAGREAARQSQPQTGTGEQQMQAQQRIPPLAFPGPTNVHPTLLQAMAMVIQNYTQNQSERLYRSASA